MLCISAPYAVVRRLSVRLSVMFVYSVETSIGIFNMFHRRVATPFCSYNMAILTGSPPTKVSNVGGVGKNRDYRLISGYRIDEWWSTIKNFHG